jgi:hypothetical protein
MPSVAWAGILADLVVRGAGHPGQRAAAVGGACVPADLAAAGLAVVALGVVDSVAAGFGAEDHGEE